MSRPGWRPPRLSAPAQYLVGVVGVAASLAGRWALDPYLGDRVPFLLTLAVLAMLAWVLSPGAFLAAAFVGIVAGDYLFVNPRHALGASSFGEAVQLGVYVVVAMLLWAAIQVARREAGRAAAASAELREKDALLRTVTEGAATMLAYVDRDLRYRYVNTALCRRFGMEREAVVGRRVPDVLGEEAFATIRPRVERALAGEEEVFEADVVFPGAGRRRVHAVYTPDRDEHGVVVGFTAAVMDVTERHLMEQAFRASEERLRMALEAGNMGTWAWDMRTGRVTWSSGLEAIHGLEPGTFGGRFEDFQRDMHPEDRERVLASLHASLRDGRPHHIEYRIIRPDRTEAWVEGRGRIVRDEAGTTTGMLGVCMDVTERKRAQEELARHRDHLQRIVLDRTAELENSHQRLRLSERMAALGTFAAGLGHDMANLLLPIRVRLEALETAAGGSARRRASDESAAAEEGEVREHAGAIRGVVRYIESLTRGLRLFAQDPEQDAEGVTDPERWCGDVQGLLRASLPRTIELRCDVPAGTPKAKVSPHRLSQAVLNLVHNARDAIASARGPEGAGRIVMKARAETDADGGVWVRVGVQDDGGGMSEEVRSRCLEPFFTTKTRGVGGTGLGLAIVHGIAQRAGGRVEIESEAGRGTTISLVVPSAEGQAPEERKPERRIYLTLSDPRAAAFAASLLASLGHEPVAGAPPWGERPDGAAPNTDGGVWVTDATAEAAELARALLHTPNPAAAGRDPADRPPADRRIVVLDGTGDASWARTLPSGEITVKCAATLPQLRAALEEVVGG